MNMKPSSRPDSSKNNLTPKLTRQIIRVGNSEQFKVLSKMYSTSNLAQLLKQTDTKKKPQLISQFMNSSPRTNTPKSCRQEAFSSRYFLPQKSNYLLKDGKVQNNSQVLQKNTNLSQHKTTLNLSTGKDTPQRATQLPKKQQQPQTDRKYNLFSLDMEKAAAKLKQQDPSRFSSHQIVAQLAQTVLKKPKQQTEKKDNVHFSLDDFVCQISRGANTSLKNSNHQHGIKQTKSLSPSSRTISAMQKNLYYVTSLINSFKQTGSQINQLYRDHAQQTFNCIGFCLNLTQASDELISQKKVSIYNRPSFKFNKTVVFDLDETLIHCNENQTLKADIYLPITFPSGDTVQAGINIRPYSKWILVALSQICEVVIFTASHQCYASKVIEYLDSTNCVSAKLYRDKCVVSDDGVHIKDLRVINRDPQDIVLIDNAAYSFGTQIENGIPIVPYYDDKNDSELKQLYEFLVTHVLPANDCRTVLAETFKLREWANFVGPKTAIEKLYF